MDIINTFEFLDHHNSVGRLAKGARGASNTKHRTMIDPGKAVGQNDNMDLVFQCNGDAVVSILNVEYSHLRARRTVQKAQHTIRKGTPVTLEIIGIDF